MKVTKWFVISSFLGGMVMICYGAYIQNQYYDSSGFFKIGGLAIAISLILWFSLGYHKQPKLH